MDRRTLFKTAFGVGVAAWANAPLLAAVPQGASTAGKPARKRILIGGKPAEVIDVHAHCEFPAVAALAAGLPFERKVPDNAVMTPRRIVDMDARGIDIAVLSVNQYWWYQAERELAARIVAMHDEALADWVKAHPDRFLALSSPALQFPDLAAQQLEHAVTTLGMKGASIGGHVGGVVPTDAKYDPFWAKAASLGVPIFLHPDSSKHLVKTGALGDLANVVGNPLETTVFLSRMIIDGVFDRFPTLTVIGAHGAGYLGSYFGRMETSCGVTLMCKGSRSPREALRSNVVADSMVFSEEGLRHLIAEMGSGQIVFGTDMPYVWDDKLDMIGRSRILTDAQKRLILSGNARRLLRLGTGA